MFVLIEFSEEFPWIKRILNNQTDLKYVCPKKIAPFCVEDGIFKPRRYICAQESMWAVLPSFLHDDS